MAQLEYMADGQENVQIEMGHVELLPTIRTVTIKLIAADGKGWYVFHSNLHLTMPEARTLLNNLTEAIAKVDGRDA